MRVNLNFSFFNNFRNVSHIFASSLAFDSGERSAWLAKQELDLQVRGPAALRRRHRLAAADLAHDRRPSPGLPEVPSEGPDGRTETSKRRGDSSFLSLFFSSLCFFLSSHRRISPCAPSFPTK